MRAGFWVFIMGLRAFMNGGNGGHKFELLRESNKSMLEAVCVATAPILEVFCVDIYA